jgi:outer membrane protein assembly factor BamB
VSIDAATGQESWSTELPGEILEYDFERDQIVLVAGENFEGDEDAPAGETDELLVLDRETGSVVWSAVVPAEHLSIVAQPARILVRAESSLIAFDRSNGIQRWDEELHGERMYADIAILDETAVIAETWNDRPGRIRSINLATGGERWSSTSTTCIQRTGAWAGDVITISCQSLTTYDELDILAFDLRDGSRLWSVSPWTIDLQASVDPQRAVIGDTYFFRDDQLIAFDMASGRVSWTAELGFYIYSGQWMSRPKELIFFQVPERGVVISSPSSLLIGRQEGANGQCRFRMTPTNS